MAPLLAVGAGWAASARADEDVSYEQQTKVIVDSYCAASCHGGASPMGGVDLSRFEISLHGRTAQQSWTYVVRLVEDGIMPPTGAARPDADQERLLDRWERDGFPKTGADAQRLTFDGQRRRDLWNPYFVLRTRLDQLLSEAGDGGREALLTTLDARRLGLGAADHGAGIGLDLVPSLRKYQYLAQVGSDLCRHPAVVATFAGRAGFARLGLVLFGRVVAAADWRAFDRISAETPSADAFYDVCLFMLLRAETHSL